MRKEFVMCESRYQAKKVCSWASKIVKVEGGYLCFECVDECRIWKSQK